MLPLKISRDWWLALQLLVVKSVEIFYNTNGKTLLVNRRQNETGGFSELVLFKRNLLRKSACFVFEQGLTAPTHRMSDVLV